MRLYRALLRLYPSSFRAEYGEELASLFAARRTRSSGLGAAALWAGEIADVASNALRVHLDLLRQDLRYAVRTFRHSPGFARTSRGCFSLVLSRGGASWRSGPRWAPDGSAWCASC